MIRAFACLAAALFLSGGRMAPLTPGQCTAELAQIAADIAAQGAGDDATLAALVERLDQLATRDGNPGSACAHAALVQAVRLELIRGRFDSIVSRTDAFSSARVHGVHPNDDSIIYYVRSQALAATGRRADAQRAISAAATLAPQLGVPRAVLILSTLATTAETQSEWNVAEAAYGRAGRIIRDSAATVTDRHRETIARMLSKQTYGLYAQMDSETTPDIRASLARRQIALADSGLALLSITTPINAFGRAAQDGLHAMLDLDAAYGEAVLERHARAMQRLAAARRLMTPEAMAVSDNLDPDYWLRRSQTDQMAGNLEAAEASARSARESCQDVEDILCTLEAEEQTAGVIEEAGRWRDAEAHYRTAARIADIEWESERMQDWGASQFADMQRPYRGLARVLLAQGRTAEAFTVLDGSRARALRDLRAWQTARTRLSPGRRTRVDSLLGVVHEQRVALLADTLQPEETSVVRSAIASAQQQIEREADLNPPARAPLDVASVQRALRQQRRTLVSYLVGDDSTAVFVLTPDTLVARTLPVGRRDIGRLMAAAGGAWSPGGPDAAVRLGPLSALYDRLVRPVVDLLPPGDGLVVIPDGPLADLPFGALLAGPPAAEGPQPFLIRSRAVSTDLAAALVPDADRPAHHFDVDLLAFGRSLFDGDGDGGGRFRSRSGPVLANLPNVATEIRRIGAYAGRRASALDGQATEARFEAQAGTARVVHVASHAEVDPVFPLNSRIYLWDDPDADDDGVVHLFELQELSLPADLVVLSGCSTAAGEAKAGEGTIGLQYGVRAAGARAAVATLWPVDDRATGELVESFYAALADGLPADRALQSAQVAYLDAHGGAEASPYFWAATVLSGSPAPILLGSPRSAWMWIAGVAAVGGLAWAARRRSAHAA